MYGHSMHFSVSYLTDGMEYSIMFPLMPLTLLSVYCLFHNVVWLDFIPVNMTYVDQFMPMCSENDLYFNFVYLTQIC